MFFAQFFKEKGEMSVFPSSPLLGQLKLCLSMFLGVRGCMIIDSLCLV